MVEIPNTHCTEEDYGFKDLDVIVLGATGTVGEISAWYLSTKDPSTFRFAIAGRDMAALDELRQKMRRRNDPEPIVMSLDNEFQMLQMMQRARVLLNFQGPFEENGATKVIHLALKTCTHYVDVSTELLWQAKILQRYGRLAAKRGVAVVQSAGATALPADFLAVRAAELYYTQMKMFPRSIKIIRKESHMLETEGMGKSRYFVKDHYGTNKVEPYVLLPGMPPRLVVDRTPDGMDFMYTKYLKWYKTAPLDCAVVRRSLLTLFKVPIPVSEASKSFLSAKDEITRNKEAADETGGKAVVDNDTNAWRPDELPNMTSQDWSKHSFPKPLMDELKDLLVGGIKIPAGYFQAEAHAFGEPEQGREVRVYMMGFYDITVVGTATFAGELAHGLADGGPLKQQGGYLTPALALGTARLWDILEGVVKVKEEVVSDPDAPDPLVPPAYTPETPVPPAYTPETPDKEEVPKDHSRPPGTLPSRPPAWAWPSRPTTPPGWTTSPSRPTTPGWTTSPSRPPTPPGWSETTPPGWTTSPPRQTTHGQPTGKEPSNHTAGAKK